MAGGAPAVTALSFEALHLRLASPNMRELDRLIVNFGGLLK